MNYFKIALARFSYQITFLFFIFLFTAITKPPMLFDQFMWAEMATDYFKNSHLSFFEQLMLIDYGYHQFPQRLISYIGNVLKIPIGLIPYFYNWSSLLLIFLLLVVFISDRYEIIIKDKRLRFAIIAIIFAISDFESINFISFTYFAGFLLTIEIIRLCLVKQLVFYDFALPIFFVSKPVILIYYPFFLALCFYIRNKNFYFLVSVITIFALIQVSTGLNFVGESSMVTVNKSLLLNSQSFITSFQVLASTFSKIFLFEWILNFHLAYIIGFLLLLIIFKKFDVKRRFIFLIILGITFAAIFFNVVVLNNWQDASIIYGKRLNRENIILYMNFILVLGLVVDNLKFFQIFQKIKYVQTKTPSVIFLSFLVINLLVPFHLYKNAFKINNPKYSGSKEWTNIENKEINKFCHSINPIGWVFNNIDCKIYRGLELGNYRMTKYDFSESSVNNLQIKVPAASLPSKFLGFFLTIAIDEKNSFYNKSPISCELSVYNDDYKSIFKLHKIYRFRFSNGIIEFYSKPISLLPVNHTFQISCDKPFFYDLYDTNIHYFILGSQSTE